MSFTPAVPIPLALSPLPPTRASSTSGAALPCSCVSRVRKHSLSKKKELLGTRARQIQVGRMQMVALAMTVGDQSSRERHAGRGTDPQALAPMAPQFPHTSKVLALGLIGLAIAVALWGFGYKVSRFNLHSLVFWRASFARLWDKHQDSAQVAEAAKVTQESNLPLQWRAPHAWLQEAPEREHEASRPSNGRKPMLSSPHSLTFLRSPPSPTVVG